MRKSANGSATLVAKSTAEQLFPNIATWVHSYGWIEIGQDDYSRSFLRALDAGGMVWEGKEDYHRLMTLSVRSTKRWASG